MDDLAMTRGKREKAKKGYKRKCEGTWRKDCDVRIEAENGRRRRRGLEVKEL